MSEGLSPLIPLSSLPSLPSPLERGSLWPWAMVPLSGAELEAGSWASLRETLRAQVTPGGTGRGMVGEMTGTDWLALKDLFEISWVWLPARQRVGALRWQAPPGGLCPVSTPAACLSTSRDEDDAARPEKTRPAPLVSKTSNPLLQLAQDPTVPTYKQGVLARKMHHDADGKKSGCLLLCGASVHGVVQGTLLRGTCSCVHRLRTGSHVSSSTVAIYQMLCEVPTRGWGADTEGD